jgi:glycosyltransferase involved in cell wall biosynthesis
MKITVIVCTYNRCKSLVKALDSLAASQLPQSVEWEVLVVDNNSRDETRDVVEDICRRYPGRFRYMFEPQPGKSHALNAAILEARGEVLAFMDDDVTVPPTWLHNLTVSLRDGEWAGSGGRILPARGFSCPSWLTLEERQALAPLAIFDHGPDACQLTEAPFGTNMAFQKQMFNKYGCFRTDLGPQPGSEIRGEDTEFGGRLLAAGEGLRYEPTAVVYHTVPETRLQKKYFLAWWFDKARADIRATGTSSDTRWRVAGIPLVLFRRLAAWTARWTVAVEPSQRFSAKLKVWILAGQVSESYRRRRYAGNEARSGLLTGEVESAPPGNQGCGAA